MKVVFIKPSLTGKKTSWTIEPLSIAVLKSLTPPHVEIAFYDDRIERVSFDDGDLIAFSVDTFSAGRAYELADEFRRRGKKVVMGGAHPTLVPEEALEHADGVVIGEAEGVWREVVEDAARGRLKGIYRKPVNDLSGIFPDRSIFRGKSYLPVSLVETGRGCRYRCNFCCTWKLYPQRKERPVEEVVEELKRIKRKIILFTDDNFTSSPEHAKNLLERIIPLKKRWLAQVDVRMLDDREFLLLLKRSGCLGVLVGFESVSSLSRREMGKGWIRKEVEYYLARLREMRIPVFASFIFGYGDDTVETVKETMKLLERFPVAVVGFNVLIPYPGTPVYEKLRKERRVHEKWWLKRNAFPGRVFFEPERMGREELERLCRCARERMYSLPSIIRRILEIARTQDTFAVFTGIVINMLAAFDVRRGWR